MNRPTKVCGSEAGTATRLIRYQGPAPSTRLTS